jgi:hypothetical protein
VGVSARAQETAQPEATRFEFRAPDGCSSAEDFSARVRRRSWRIRLVTDASARRSLMVEIQQPGAAGVLRGTVTVVEADGATRTRQLKAASCEEAVDALSLIATVTLDPDAMLGESPPEPPAKKPEPPPKPSASGAQGPRKPPPHFRRPPPNEPYRFSFGLAGTVLLNLAPQVVPAGMASVAFEINPGSWAAPFWRLSVTHGQRRGLPEAGREAAFAFTLPTLDACPVRLGPRALGVRPCVFGSLGLLRVWGDGTLRDEDHSRLYGAAGVSLWAGWRVSEIFEIIADGRMGVPFRRDEFALEHKVFFTTPTLGFSAGLGVAGGFP